MNGPAWTLTWAAAALRAGDVTSVALTEACLAVCRAQDATLGALIHRDDASALEAAALADAELARGVDRGPLHGVPFGLKDLLATADAPTTANSRVLDPAWGAGYDAVVVERVRAAGAVVLGKLVLSEFALGPPELDHDLGFPIPRNPWNPAHSAGGSSSGCGVAVAAGMVLGSLGTDTAGSVRFPAASCGHTGLKVTYGAVPKWGCVPLAYSLDSIGPMARSARDCAAIFAAIAGSDRRDPTSRNLSPAGLSAVGRIAAEGPPSVAGLRIGLPQRYFFDHELLEPATRSAVLTVADTLAAAGADVVDVDVPRSAEAKEATLIIMLTEAFAYHRLDMASPKWELYGPALRRAIARGALYRGADYVQAQRFRSWWTRQVDAVFETVDLLLTPATLGPAPTIEGYDLGSRLNGPSFASPWNLCGNPALAMPCGFSDTGLPLSVQLVGRRFDEATVLGAAATYQDRTDWHQRVPPWPPVGSTAP